MSCSLVICLLKGKSPRTGSSLSASSLRPQDPVQCSIHIDQMNLLGPKCVSGSSYAFSHLIFTITLWGCSAFPTTQGEVNPRDNTQWQNKTLVLSLHAPQSLFFPPISSVPESPNPGFATYRPWDIGQGPNHLEHFYLNCKMKALIKCAPAL